MNENIIMTCCVFLMGASFGSFLNVVISRVPLGINIVFPDRTATPAKLKSNGMIIFQY